MEKRPEHAGSEVIWQIAARRSTYKKLSKRSALYEVKRKIEKTKAQVRAKVRQFDYTKVRFRGRCCTNSDAIFPVDPVDGPSASTDEC